jgi:hypothetical protein
MKTRVFLYVVASSSNPDNIKCPVPWMVNESEIFFGPCKKRLREYLKNEYLEDKNHLTLKKDNVIIIGVNGSNKYKKRKIVFVGRVNELMTFEQAFNRLKGKKYEVMLNKSKSSPLHVEPNYIKGKFIGYKYRKNGHHKMDWQSDLSSTSKDFSLVKVQDADRDCCMLLENIHFAKEGFKPGINITEKMVSILSKEQERKDINDYAIFGYRKDKSAEGKTGTFLELKEKNGILFLDAINRALKNI